MSLRSLSHGLGYGGIDGPASDRIGGDPAAPDTPADKAGGALGLLSNLLRVLFTRFYPPWVIPPPGFRSYDVQASIPAPVAGGATAPFVTVLTLQVPTGFVTCVKGLSIVYSGGGFQQGAGALVYRITVDDAPIKGYGMILTDLGTMNPGDVQPRAVAGIFARSNQTIRVQVQNVAQPGGGTFVVATLVGYHYAAAYHTSSWTGR